MKNSIRSHRNSIGCVQLAIVLLCATLRLTAQPGNVGAWNGTTDFPYWIEYPEAVVFEGRIYVFGGYASASTIPDSLDSSVHVATIGSSGLLSSWALVSSFNYGRWLHAVALNPDTRTVYVVGGAINTGLVGTNLVQFARLLPGGGLSGWTTTTPLPTAISGHKAVCSGSYLYVFRGNDQYGGAAQGYYYAPISSDGNVGMWRQGTLSFPSRRYFGAFAYNDHFYLVGGDTGLASGQNALNDVRTARVPQRSSLPYLQMNETEFWNSTTPFQVSRWFQGTVCKNGFVYITGGKTTPGFPPDRSDVQFAKIRVDGSLDTWQTAAASLPTSLSGHACVADDAGHIYVIGGDYPFGGGYKATAGVLYSTIQSANDTTPPKTQISPAAGPQPSSPINVTLTASDVGGAVMSIRWTTNGDDPRNPGAFYTIASSVSFSLPIPATLRVSARDAAGNDEVPQTAKFSVTTTHPVSDAFDWPVGSLSKPVPSSGPKCENPAAGDDWYIAQCF